MLPLNQETLPADSIYIVAGIANIHDLTETLGEGEARLFFARALRRAESTAKHFHSLVVERSPDHVIIQASNREIATSIVDAVREKFAALWVPHGVAVEYFTRINERLISQRRSSLYARITYGKNTFTLDETTPLFTVGRLQSACLTIDSVRVSRRHATLELKNGIIYLNDTSTNGTFIKFEGEQEPIRVVHGKYEIRRNAVMTFGSTIDKLGADRIVLEIYLGTRK